MSLPLLKAVGPVLMALAMALALTRRKLVRQAGVLHATGGGRLWLDEPAWQAHRQSRRRRALAVVVAVLVALLVLFATGRLGAR